MAKGTVFNLDEVAGDWFDFFESEVDIKTGEIIYHDPNPGTGRVCIRSMAPFWRDRNRTRKKKAEFVRNPNTRAMERVEYTDMTPEQEATERDDAFDYAITGFENLFDNKGKPITCTRENKLKLLAIPAFDRFIARCFEMQQNTTRIQNEVAEKNLETP